MACKEAVLLEARERSDSRPHASGCYPRLPRRSKAKAGGSRAKRQPTVTGADVRRRGTMPHSLWPGCGDAAGPELRLRIGGQHPRHAVVNCADTQLPGTQIDFAFPFCVKLWGIRIYVWIFFPASGRKTFSRETRHVVKISFPMQKESFAAIGLPDV